MTITTSIDGSGTADERRAEFLEHGTAGGAGQGADR
jgi:hypothetical protein